MVLDYNNKNKSVGKSSNISKNRPRKQPIGMFLAVVIFFSLISFGAGGVIGWFIARSQAQKALAKQQPLSPAVDKNVASSSQQPPLTGQDIPLTFYKTLPHGAKAVIGSGLNLKIEEMTGITRPLPTFTPEPPSEQQALKSAPTPVPAPVALQKHRTEQAVIPAKPAARIEDKESSPAKNIQVAGAFTVQVASHRDKKEAESLKEKLLAKGLAAYVVESKRQDKSIWYRVRIGKKLSQEEATLLAEKAGKGAMPLPE